MIQRHSKVFSVNAVINAVPLLPVKRFRVFGDELSKLVSSKWVKFTGHSLQHTRSGVAIGVWVFSVWVHLCAKSGNSNVCFADAFVFDSLAVTICPCLSHRLSRGGHRSILGECGAGSVDIRHGTRLVAALREQFSRAIGQCGPKHAISLVTGVQLMGERIAFSIQFCHPLIGYRGACHRLLLGLRCGAQGEDDTGHRTVPLSASHEACQA